MKLTVRSSKILFHVHPSVYLWVATLIFAASSSVTRKLTELGASHLIDGRNPISLCNVLFVGNLCALAVMIPLFRKDLTIATFCRLTRKDWIGLSVVALLSGALAPALIFAALDRTTVTSVVLISRLEPVLGLVLSMTFLRERINAWTFAGTVFSFAGVAIAALAAPSYSSTSMEELPHAYAGEVLVAMAAVILAIAEVVSKKQLQSVPLSLFSTFRTAIGTIIFFSIATTLYGVHHFVDAFSPFLWKWMLLYGTLIVVVGQSCWFQGIKHASLAEITLASSFNPLAAILIACFALKETPTSSQVLGGSIILLGVGLSAIGKHYHKSQHNQSQHTVDEINSRKFVDMEMGFKGL